MRFNDIVSGVLLLGLAVVLWVAAAGLPNPAAQVYGPAFFPKVIAIAMGLSAVVLIATSLGQARTVASVAFDDWIRDPVRVFRFLLVPAMVIFYVYTVDEIGFLLSASAVLAILLLALGVRPLPTLAVTAGMVALIYAIFDLLLRVPLPRGDMFYA